MGKRFPHKFIDDVEHKRCGKCTKEQVVQIVGQAKKKKWRLEDGRLITQEEMRYRIH